MASAIPGKPSRVSVLAGPITRTWNITANARTYTVQLYHNTITGERSLSIDGAEVSGTAGSTSILSPTKVLVFELPDGGKGTVTLTHNATNVEYVCLYRDAPVPEENDILNGGDTTKDTVNKLRCTVERGEVGMDSTGKPVVWFRIHTVRENDEKETFVHRRFRDFFAVNEALRSAYKGSHLLSSFPELPPRSFKLWEDHLSTEFIDKRKWQLQEWLYKVSQIPRMRANPDFLTFIGCIENVREVSVLFPKDVNLGVTLSSAGDFVEVSALKPLADGSPSPAQTSNLIRVGDKISKINGDDCLGDSYDVIVAKVKSAPRPVMIHFLGLFESSPRRGDESPDIRAVSFKEFVPSPKPLALASEPVPAPAPAVADPRAVTGLIGEGISYVGTGATPRPGAPARTGLAHHATAEAASKASADTGAFNGLL